MSTAMHRLKFRSVLQVGRSDGTGFCSTSVEGGVVGDKVRLGELVVVVAVVVVVEFEVGFIVDDGIDGFIDGGIDCALDGEMDGTSEDTTDGLFETVPLGSIDGTAEGNPLGTIDGISLGELDGHVLPVSPKSIICSILLLPVLLPWAPTNAMTSPS